MEWEALRGHDLHDKPHGWYRYFSPNLRANMEGADNIFEQAEAARAEIRAGGHPDDYLIWSYNEPPGLWIEMHAVSFGWRLVPLTRKTAIEFNQPDFTLYVESRVQSWLAKADVVWELLESLPDNRKSRESFAAYIHPLRVEARQIENTVRQWLDTYHDVAPYKQV